MSFVLAQFEKKGEITKREAVSVPQRDVVLRNLAALLLTFLLGLLMLAFQKVFLYNQENV